MSAPHPALEPYVLNEVARLGADVTRAHVYGVPANFLTAMRYPCHDRDILRDLFAEARLKVVDWA